MIEFTVDYRGVLTNEQWYQAGQQYNGPNQARLVAAHRAKWLAPAPLTLEELRNKAKEAGIKGYARMKRATLLKKLGLDDG